MEIENEKKQNSDDESSSNESNEIGVVSQKLELKFDFLAENVSAIKKNNSLLSANKIFLGLWGSSSVFLQAICEGLLKKSKALLAGYLNFNRAKQKALANIYFIDDSSYIIVFNEAIKEYSDCDFPAFIQKHFYLDPKSFEFIVLDNVSNKLLKTTNNLEKLHHISTNHHTKESFEKVKTLAVPLEEGNGIEGIGADVLIYCEINKLMANLFLGINEEYEISLKDVKKFEKILCGYKALEEVLNEKIVSDLIKKANKANYSSVYL